MAELSTWQGRVTQSEERLQGMLKSGNAGGQRAMVMIPTERFDDALGDAGWRHRAQCRKGTTIPTIAHLRAVSALVIEHGGSEDQAIAALLHDAAEDQGGEAALREIEARYGAEVAKIVADCTDSWVEPKPPWRARKEAYLASLPAKPASSLLVSLADKTHNARAITSDREHVGEAIWDRFTGGKAGTLWYYRTLDTCFGQILPSPLATELSRAMDAMAA